MSMYIWNKTKPLTNRLGESINHTEAVKRYGVVANAEKVLIEENDDGQLVAIDDLSVLCHIYGVNTDGLTDDEIIAAIDKAKEPKETDNISAEEALDIILGGEVDV